MAHRGIDETAGDAPTGSADSAPSSKEPAAAAATPKNLKSVPAALPPGSARRGLLSGRHRRRSLVLLVALVAIAAVVAVEVPQWLFPSGTQSTIWQNITDGITNGTVPKQTALEAFAYVYKVDVPGVKVPDGVEGGDEPDSGTGVVSWVQANWKSLSPEQQAVVNRYISPGVVSGTAHEIPAAFGTPSPGGTSSVTQPKFQLDKVGPIFPIDTNLAPDAPADLAIAMGNEILKDIAHLGPKLGLPTIPIGSLAFPKITLNLVDADGGDAYFLTQIAENTNIGAFEPCNITAYHNTWPGQQVDSNGDVGPTLHVLLTHEVVHCYQNTVWGSIATALAIPAWMKEGSAMWLAADDTGIEEPVLGAVWVKGYFGRDGQALTDRTYDSFGWFALLQHQGRDLWSLMAPAWKAAAAATERSNAFIAALGGDNSDIVNNWAESYLRRSDWSDPWIAYGFELPDAAKAPQIQAQAQESPGWIGSVNSRANQILDVTSTSGEVVTVATVNGLASVHDENGNTATAFTSQTFCTTESCVCPNGTLLAGQNMATQKLSIPFVAAFNGSVGGSTYSITSATLDDLCKHPATPRPQPTANYGPCGSSCSQSNGDPHILTLNKYRYNFQAAGEFTLLESPDGSVDIQSRQEPYGTDGYVSINTAIAAKVGTHRVGVYMTKTGLDAKLDGQALDLSAGPKDLGGGASISTVAKGFQINFPDGTILWTLSVGQYGINAQVKPSAGLRADGMGLLGPIAPSGLQIPALPDGSRLPAATNDAQRIGIINGRFADAWRVTDATTLFDYDDGKSTETYTIKPYPTNNGIPNTAGLSGGQKAAGDAACSAITDPGLHDDCVYDVGVTGQTGFAANDAALEGFWTNGVVPPTSAPVAGTTPSPSPGGVSGAMIVANNTGTIGGYALGPDNTVFLTVQAADGTNSLISVDPVAGKIIKQVSVPADTAVHFAAGSLWLPGLKTDSNGKNCSISRFDPASLTELATIQVPCNFFGTVGAVAGDGDALWYMDVSKYDSGTQKGAVMVRIDPQTNQPGATAELPSIDGYFLDSQGAYFYDDSQRNYYRLTTGSTAFENMGSMKKYFSVVAAGTGLWAQDSSGKTADYYGQPGSPVTVQVGGTLVGGSSTAVFEEVLANSDQGVTQEQLWVFPLDGSPPSEVTSSPTIDGQFLGYAEDPLPITNGNGLLKVWSKRTGSGQTPTILLQWTAIP